MIKVAYFDCYSGASGDMLLGALLDKAVDFDWFCNEIKKLNLPEDSYKLTKTYVDRSSISSCKINIDLTKHEHVHRGYKEICKILDNSQINEKACKLSKEIFFKIAKAEAQVHNKSIEEIHFHEVGAMDSIIDIAGFSICYTSLNVDKCYVSPVPVGSGTVECAHGCLPVPAPATLEMLKENFLIIKQNNNIKEECFTPTACAILSTIANKCTTFPDFDRITSTGYGAGDKVFCNSIVSNLRFVIGEKD